MAGIQPADEPGKYYVNGATWEVGRRYELIKQLGEGSFSQVALAVDKETGEKVALKRIPDVLQSLENAKRVLREVCILRRMDHPGIIALKDVFLRPASSGAFVYRKGQLVPKSLDLYLALEYCDRGDLFHIKGQISESDVKSIMFQLLQALQYLHDNGVWHRDVKTANILVTYSDGARLAKIADLGSARSATARNGAAAGAASPPGRRRHGRNSSLGDAAGGGGAGGGGGAAGGWADGDGDELMRHTDSFVVDLSGHSCSELFARPAAGGGAGFRSPLTRMVCTPCYRAPEVVMSRGAYTQAIDVWSAGCVFGELLQRVPWLGKASTPHLQVAPVFAMQGAPKTPVTGQRYNSPTKAGSATTRLELQALFQVIGTPSWKCIEDVPSEAWRNYLRKIPGRAPTLYRRFGVAGEVAVDLLQRLLTFDPARRASCAEAMAHEYFAGVRAAAAADELEQTEEETASEDEAACGARARAAAAAAGDEGMDVEAAAEAAADAQAQLEPQEAAAQGIMALTMDVDDGDGAERRPAGSCSADGKRPGRLEAGDGSGSFILGRLPKRPKQGSGGGGAGAAGAGSLAPQLSFKEGERGEHYYNIDDPAVALAKLEEEMGAILSLADGGKPGPPSGSSGAGSEAAAAVATDAFRELLEREVSEHSQHLEARRARIGSGGAAGAAGAGAAQGNAAGASPGGAPAPSPRDGGAGGPRTPGGAPGAASPVPRRMTNPGAPPFFNAGSAAARRAATAGGGAGSSGGIGQMDSWGHAREDPGGAGVDASLLAQRRLPHHADAEQASLDAETHLKSGRHGEWAADSLKAGPKTGGAWGVTLVPPGYDEEAHPEIAEIVRSQNKR